MQEIMSFYSSHRSCRRMRILLAFGWIAGLLLGVFFAHMTADRVVSLMHTAADSRVSIVGLITVVLFPLLISAAAIRLSIPFALYLVSFLKAISLGYCLLGSIVAFSSSGWIICFLLSFSDIFSSVVLLYFWFYQFSENRGMFKKNFGVCVLADSIILLIDVFWVSPFLVGLVT